RTARPRPPKSPPPQGTTMRRRTLLSLASATALGGALAACGPAVTGEDPDSGGGASGTVRVGHVPSTLFAPLYVADALGCFEDAGTGRRAAGTVRVGHVPSTLFAPLYVADAMVCFEDAGITVELTPLKSGQDGIPMLSNDQLDVMIAGFSAGMFNALDQGLAFKIVGSMGISPGDPENSPTALEVSQSLLDDGSVATVADLKGRTIGVAGGPGATGGYLLAAMLEED